MTVTGQAGAVTIHVPLLVEAGPNRGLARAQTPPLNMAELTVPVPLPVPSPVTPILAQVRNQSTDRVNRSRPLLC